MKRHLAAVAAVVLSVCILGCHDGGTRKATVKTPAAEHYAKVALADLGTEAADRYVGRRVEVEGIFLDEGYKGEPRLYDGPGRRSSAPVLLPHEEMRRHLNQRVRVQGTVELMLPPEPPPGVVVQAYADPVLVLRPSHIEHVQ
jgi:hypothetical protein